MCSSDLYFLFVANGVTTVRGMLGWPGQLELRDRVNRGELIGPSLYLAGPSFSGSTVPTPPQAVARVREQKAQGTARTLVGFEMQDRGIARHGYPIVANGAVVGHVTSGTQTPFLKKAIGMGYVPTSLAAPGTTLDVDIRGRLTKAVMVRLPFYKRT